MVNKEFFLLIREIIKSKDFDKMKHYKHHIKGNVFDHSVKVAYLCYRHHKRKKSKLDLRELVRGALLHDYYLYDWHSRTPETRWHLFTHPTKALKNATQEFPDLTKNEQDMIRHHMFPIVPFPPKTKYGWLVCWYDKIAAISDYVSKNKWKAHPNRYQWSCKKVQKSTPVNI